MRSHRIGGRGKRRHVSHPIRIVSSWDAALRLVDGKTVEDTTPDPATSGGWGSGG